MINNHCPRNYVDLNLVILMSCYYGYHRMQQWRNQFVHLALIWMDVLSKQVKEWILNSLQEDQVHVIPHVLIYTIHTIVLIYM